MLDHVIVTVSDFTRSIAFYEQALKPLGITEFLDYKGQDGHPDLKGFGNDGRFFFWQPLNVWFALRGTLRGLAQNAELLSVTGVRSRPSSPTSLPCSIGSPGGDFISSSSDGEGETPADIGRKDVRVEEDERGAGACHRAHPEAAVDHDVDAAAGSAPA